jgi:hypothetical protein
MDDESLSWVNDRIDTERQEDYRQEQADFLHGRESIHSTEHRKSLAAGQARPAWSTREIPPSPEARSLGVMVVADNVPVPQLNKRNIR